MNQLRNSLALLLLVIMYARSSEVIGTVVEYQSSPMWQNAIGQYSTLSFTGFPANTNITTQYSNLGVVFTDGQDLVLPNSGFLNDGWGLNGAFDSTALSFSQPITAIAADFPGFVQFQLFSQGELLYTSNLLGMSGVGNFAGVVSSEPFDAVVVSDPTGGLFLDDLHFGPPIPGPGVLSLVATAGLAGFGRRRREHA